MNLEPQIWYWKRVDIYSNKVFMKLTKKHILFRIKDIPFKKTIKVMVSLESEHLFQKDIPFCLWKLGLCNILNILQSLKPCKFQQFCEILSFYYSLIQPFHLLPFNSRVNKIKCLIIPQYLVSIKRLRKFAQT